MEKIDHASQFAQLAEQLDDLNHKENGGKGYQHVDWLIEDLRKGDPFKAREDIRTASFDKFGNIPDIKGWVINNLFRDFKHPWETDDSFYERLSQRGIIEVDTRLDENKSTPEGIRQLLISRGYTEILPPHQLTQTRLTENALFSTVTTRTSEEVLAEELGNAEVQTGKKWVGKVLVRAYDQGQKLASVFIRPEVKMQEVVPGYNSGTYAWTESDGLMVAKASAIDKDQKRRIQVTILKKFLPDLIQRIDGLNDSSNLPVTVQETNDKEDYLIFYIDTYRAHNANLAFSSLKSMLETWLIHN